MQMKVCFYFHFRVKWSLSHPSPVGTNGRCSAIAEGKQRVNQLTEQEGNSSRLFSTSAFCPSTKAWRGRERLLQTSNLCANYWNLLKYFISLRNNLVITHYEN